MTRFEHWVFGVERWAFPLYSLEEHVVSAVLDIGPGSGIGFTACRISGRTERPRCDQIAGPDSRSSLGAMVLELSG
ncbi:MAG: hypothetical protein DMF02_01110 [Verrucomicrobia bacterium]|nr:MAG: hypothetical protein DMF02_01110 [Verrucomicrobiota bacterium]